MIARGTFDVTVTPASGNGGSATAFSRLLLEKQFHGDLVGTSKGQMLGAETAIKGSGAYVAFELVSGTLHGKRGTFILQHHGTMQKGSFAIHVTVVPDSGTEELTGISGRMSIIIDGKQHSYEFEYALGG